jgi:hypothetical protein
LKGSTMRSARLDCVARVALNQRHARHVTV